MTNKIDGGLPMAPVLRTSHAAARTAPATSEPASSVPSMDSLRLTGEATSLLNLQREIASSASFDADKVASVRRALEDGTYQVNAARIADAMLGLDRQLAG